MAQAGTFQFGVDESFLSQSVSRSLINGAKMAQKSGAFSPTVNDQAFRQPLGRITGDVNKFESSLSAANQRVIAFGASASVFYGVSTAIKGLLTSTVQVNKAMVDINAIFGLSANSLVKFKNELFDVSRKTSQSFDAVAESAKEFSRQGLSVSETLKRVRDSMILTRLTGLSAAEAANTLTAAVNSFNKSGLDTTQILNKMVAADSAFAVSSKDLADALTRVGSTAQDAGVQFDELLALVTSVKQITGREGAVIANGLKTIFNRVERSETLEMFDSLKIKIKDANSNILPTIEILKNLASQYDTLGVSGKQMVAEMVGGVYQINILKAAMGDLSKENSIYDQALRQVGKAQDEAIKRNEYLNTSFAAMIQQAQNTFSQIGSNLGEKIFTSNTNSLQSAIKDLFGKENFDNFLDGLKGVDAEGTGNTIGQGLIKGIGNVFGVSGGVPGPGLLALGIGVSKVLGTSLKMVMGDFNSLLGLNQKIQNINTGVERALIGANEAEKQRLATAKTLADQEKIILEILLRQNAAMAQMKTERAALKGDILAGNSAVAKAVGAQAILAAKSIPRAAGGLIPALAQESHSISKGVGGASPSAKPVLIPNFNFGGGKTGPIVANTDEYLVPNYAGRGSAIFNKEMVAKSGVPSGAIRVAAGGFSPINIENQFGRLFGELSNSGQFTVNGITTAQKGMGYSNKLYAELIGLLGEKGARSIFGKLVPQEAFDNPNIKAILPQLTRGKHGRSNLLRMFGEDDQFGPAINFRGGSNFDTDLGNNAGRILRMMQQGYGATEFTTFLANGYIPNFSRRGRPSIKGRQIRYEGDMDFSSVLGPEGLMNLFTIFGFGLGNHPHASTIDRKSLEKFGIKIPEGLTPGSKFPYRGAAGGLLPKSLSDAIYREKKAGIPESSIYIDKDNRLISPQNPLGLLIANRRDEPAGGFQGVDRLQRIGLNPKLAGTTDVPNFAERPASELLLKYLTKGSDPKSILGNITYPGSTASMGEAQKSIEKYLGGIIKNISLKDVDFLSEGFVKQIQTKVKTAVESSFSGVNFGKSSIFGKITDQIIESREKEIRSLQNYQIALKQNEEIAKKATLEQNKRAIEEANAYTNYTLGKDRFFEGSSSGLASDYKVPTNEQIQQDRKRREQNAQKLYALQDQLTRNTINYKLGRGVRLENLSGVERSQYLSELQNKAISKLGLTSSGASAEQILANPQAQAQIDKYVRDQIRGLTQNATNRAISKITATAALNEKLASGSKFYQDLSGKEQTMLIKEFTRKAYSQYNFQGAGISYMQALRNTESRQLMDNYVQQEIAKMSRNQISTTPTAWQKWKDRMGSPIGQMAMMMGPSMISGFIPEGRGGTTSGRALGGVQGMLQGMGTGAMFGPWGAAIGAGVGGLMGVVSKWNKSFDEVAREIDEANTKNKKVVTDIGLYIQQTGEITEAVNEGLSPRRVRELVDKQIQLFSSFEDPNIRKDIISGRPEDALRKAQQNQLNRLNAGEVVSSFSRANEEVGFTRFLAKYPKLSSFALNPMFGSSINKISELTGSNIFEKVGVGTLSQKNKEIASTSVLNIMDKFTESDLKKLSESINKDGITALENFKNQLNLTSGDIKQMSEDIPNKKEFLDIFNSAIEQRTKQLNIQKEFGGNIEDLMKRFQISNLQWQEVGFQTQLNANRVNIAGQSGLRTRNTLNTARIELNPNLTDVVRSEMLGEDQLANLQASNRLSLFGAAQSARVGLSTIAQESSIVGPDQILKMNEIFKSIADSGDLSSLEKEINNLTQLQKNAFDVAKDSKNNDKQFHGASVSYLREQYQKLDDLLRSSRAAEEELKIQTSVNTIRIKEGQRQNLMNNANYSVDIFAQARRNREAAEGLPFTRGPYRQGLMLQAKINEQDYLSSLGIVQSSESLNNYNALKQSRAQATIATLLQQETGQKVNPNDIAALREASSRSANASRYKETIDLFGFNAQQEISKLSTGTGASYNEIVDKLMKSGADPLQSTIAMNTGKTAEVSTTINSNMVDGFSRIENLWQAAITSNKGAEVIKSAVGEKMGLYGEIGILKEERTKKLKANESTTDIDTKITELEQKYVIADRKVNDLLNNRNKLISQNGSGTTTAISQLNQQTAAVNSEGSPVILEPFEVKESRDQKEAVDEITNSLRGLKQGIIDASTEWGTFAQLGEATGKTLVNAAGEGFGAFVVGSMNSTAAFRNFAASVISDIAKIYAQKAMTGLIAGALGSIGGMFGSGGISESAGNSMNATNAAAVASLNNTGGSILKFAMGGKVPALLTGGEYYFNPSTAKSIGQNNLNAINHGTARFAGGGLVRGGSGYMDDVPAMLDNGGFVVKRSAVQKYGAGNLSALARNLGGEVRMYASGGNVSPAMGSFGSSSGASGNTNVKIELHDNRTSASATSDDSVNDPEFNKRLSIAIKSTVLNTVNEQRRIGGTLRQASNY